MFLVYVVLCFFFFKQKTAYEMRISDWSSDVCSSDLLDVPEGHLCCGSAGTYNLLQPELATRLRDRKAANIESIRPQLVATGNVGCMTQIAGGTALPVVHTVELLDWATGGPMPQALAGLDLVPGQRAQAAE